MNIYEVMTILDVSSYEDTLIKLFPGIGNIPNPNWDEIIDEVDYYCERFKHFGSYIISIIDPEKYNIAYNTMHGISEITPQLKSRHKRLDIFDIDYWNDIRFYMIDDNTLFKDLPMSEEVSSAVDELIGLSDDFTIGNLKNLITALTVTKHKAAKVFSSIRKILKAPDMLPYPLNLLYAVLYTNNNILYPVLYNNILYNNDLFTYNSWYFLLNTMDSYDINSYDINHINRLTSREKDILTKRFRDNRTLATIANEYIVTSETIRRIEAKSLRKLRRRSLLYNIINLLEIYDKCPKNILDMIVTYLTDYDKQQYSTQLIDTFIGNKIELIMNNEFIQASFNMPVCELFNSVKVINFVENMNTGTDENKNTSTDENKNTSNEVDIHCITVESLDLSIRGFNRFKILRLNTVGDIVNFLNEHSIMDIRYLGKKTAIEFYDTMARMNLLSYFPESFINEIRELKEN